MNGISQTPTAQTAVAKRTFSLLCLALFLFLQTLAAAPALHGHVHHEANKSDHHCAVTMLVQGKIHFECSVPLMAPVSTIVYETPTAPVPILVAVDYRLLPGRGPPTFRS